MIAIGLVRSAYGAEVSRLIDIDRQTLMTVAGATPNLWAVGLIPLPPTTHAQI